MTWLQLNFEDAFVALHETDQSREKLMAGKQKKSEKTRNWTKRVDLEQKERLK